MAVSGVDKEKLMLQFSRLEEHLNRLNEIKRGLKSPQKEDLLLCAAERLLQLAVQDCLNIGAHLIAGLGLKRADTYREVFTRLKEERIIPEKLGEVMEGFATLRNRLVHLYWEVAREEVMSKLDELHHLRDFARQVLEYVERR